MPCKVLNAETLAEEMVANGLTREAKVYLGEAASAVSEKNSAVAKVNINGVEAEGIPYRVTSRKWKNSAARFELMRDLKTLKNQIDDQILTNAAQAPDSTTLATYFAKLFIDVQRQADELADYSGSIYNVLSRPDAQEVTYLRDLIPYVGKEKTISGANDPVPLLEANLANQVSITQTMKAFGYKGSIKNMLFLPIDELQRVTEAAAIINVDSRNNDVIGHIVGISFNTATGTPKHYQAADSTSGATYDELMYNTLRKLYKKLIALKHPLTGKSIAGTGRVKMLCHPADLWAIERVVRGELMGAGGLKMIGSALPVDEIITYAGGIMDGETWGKETLSLPGVTQGYVYMFIQARMGGYVLDKRPMTLEVGRGSVLELSTEERAWYRVNGLYHTWFDGNATSDGSAAGTGFVVKAALPSDT